MKGLNHHLLCTIQCRMNGVLINEVPKFLAPIPSKTMHAIQLENPFDATHLIIIPLKLNGGTRYFKVKKPTKEEKEDNSIIKIELTAEAPWWDPSSSDYSQQEQCMFDYRGRFVHCMLMMLQMLWMTTIMPQCWKVLSVPHPCK